MADNVKSKSLFAAVLTFFITSILFTIIGAFVFDVVTKDSPAITKSSSAWAERAAYQLLQTIKVVEGLK